MAEIFDARTFSFSPHRLRASLAVDRMVFGQPRQEDLVAYMLDRVPASELEKLMQELRIELTPGGGEGTARWERQ